MRNYKKFCFSLILPLLILPFITLLYSLGKLGYDTSHLSFFLFFTNLQTVYFQHLPLLFASSVTLIFAHKMDGTSILSGVIAYIVITQLLNNETFTKALRDSLFSLPTAFTYIQISFIGILCGFIAAFIYNHFYNVQLPQSLAFFSGRRLVPIITGFIMIFISGIIYLIWPVFIQSFQAIISFLSSFQKVGAGMLFMLQKLVTPLGLSTLPFFTIQSTPIFHIISATAAPIMLLCIYRCSIQSDKPLYFFLFFMTSIACLFMGSTLLLDILILATSPILYLVYLLLGGLLILLYNYIAFPLPIMVILSLVLYGGSTYLTIKHFHIIFNLGIHKRKQLDQETLLQIMDAFGGFENIIRFSYTPRHVNILVVDTHFTNFDIFPKLGYSIPFEKHENQFEWYVEDAQSISDSLQNLHLEAMNSLVF